MVWSGHCTHDVGGNQRMHVVESLLVELARRIHKMDSHEHVSESLLE
jgi:hypothetical protein